MLAKLGVPSRQGVRPMSLVTMAFRELGEGGVWCCRIGELQPAALLSCDVRRGRPPEQRAERAQALIEACLETLGLRSDSLVVEFTQHTSDEMYRAGRGWVSEWTRGDECSEGGNSLEVSCPLPFE